MIDLNGDHGLYRKEDDFYDDSERKFKNEVIEENPLLRTDVHAFIAEEMSEPDISYWCSDSPEATTLLRKCIKGMNEKGWKTLKIYLKNLDLKKSGM
jgi:hypothetical protein